jgi:polar amino acid transport system substrate-binding protein
MPDVTSLHLDMTCVRRTLAALFFVLAMHVAPYSAAAAKDSLRLAPKGELRVAVVLNNPALVVRSVDGQLGGVAVEVATALGDRLGFKSRIVPYENQTRYNQSIGKDEWDIAIGARDLSRTGVLAFSSVFMEVDNGFVTRPGLNLSTAADVDRAGIKIAVTQGSVADGFLTRSIKLAAVVRVPGGRADAKEMLSSGRADVYAETIAECYRLSAELPGATVLVGRFNASQVVIALPKASASEVGELNEFLADAKRTGLLADAIKRAGLRGIRTPR